MRVIFFLMLITVCSFCHVTQAQNIAQTESRYKSAVDDYKHEKYAAAMEKLSPLTNPNLKTPYSTYSQYYYALSAYQLKQYPESKQMLLQLLSSYPGWNRINDVYYLLGTIALENGRYKEGLDYLLKIKDSSFNKDITALKQLHLENITDLAILKDLHRQYASDREIALALSMAIESNPSATQSDMLLDEQLQKQFKFSKKEKVAVTEETGKRSTPRSEGKWTKGYLDVSVLLPFRLDEFNTAKRRSNQFAYDYYLGMEMARELLATEGIQVNIWAYDVVNDAKSMKSIVDNKNFQLSDLVVGPLYSETFNVTAEFVNRSGMIMLNPLSTDGNLIKSASGIYLAHPSIAFQTQKAVQWIKTQSFGLSAAIYYGSTAKDSAMAFSYAAEWTGKGGKVLEMIKIQPDREWLESSILIAESMKPAHVALFTSDGRTGTMVMEVLKSRKLASIPVLATSTSFNQQESRLSKYGSKLFLINADYVDREKETIRQFQKDYFARNNTFPSVYSYQGYDQLLYFARMLNTYKDKFSSGLRSGRNSGQEYLLSGFDYSRSNENQITPVIKFNGFKWVPVDR
ncbi:ABC transporter substrate-binding protein [Dyadobacter flavalbus]|uniref:ABC transporter substrate-binding protein n=1 Tax=Dyadobacter flavalbus TaxID=2579942 RepID=A0A5M8QWM1_9BACT|nr:ABC transporter substrate-binding protein [Dyadobacter flavalbus]KAA6439224.1 ABC transporter substrate-binding protein [Dyadobacter flavalbus]